MEEHMSEENKLEPASSTEAELRVAAAAEAGTLADFEPQNEEEKDALLAVLLRRERLQQERTEKMRKVVYAYGYDPTYDKYWKNGYDDAAGATRAEISMTMFDIATGFYDTPRDPNDEFLAEELRDTEPTEADVQAYKRRT